MTVFIILLILGACVVFPLYCALVAASREDDRLENRDDPPKGEDESGAADYYYLPELDYTGKPWWECPLLPRGEYGDEDRKKLMEYKTMGKNNKKQQRICENYAKPCPLANRCDNCKKRVMHKTPHGIEIRCRDRNDVNGDTSKCFVCTSEGLRCKEETGGGRRSR